MSVGTLPARLALALSALLLALQPSLADAQTSSESTPLAEGVYARVIVERAVLRSGPGARFQAVRRATRGDVFRIVSRSSRGYWFRVALADGTSAWVHGDTVYNHQVNSDEATGGRFAPEVFAPPALPDATGELAVMFGILGFFNGFMAVRPTLNLAPALGLEANLAGSVGDGGRMLIASGGPVVNLWPNSPIVPFFTVGGGFAVADANADSFLFESGMVGALYGGGGLRIQFRYRITLRIEARGYAFFDENQINALEEITAGATVFF